MFPTTKMVSYEDRIRCEVLWNQGQPATTISDQIGISRSAVYKIVQRAQTTGSHRDRPRTGRPKVSSIRDDRAIIRKSLQDRRLAVPDLRRSWEEDGVYASNSTVRRRLLNVGLNACRATKKPLLTPVHRAKRLAFAQAHSDWSWVDWSTVLFSDESKFNLFQSDGPVIIRRRANESLLPECVVPTVKFNGGGVMMWGAMSYRGVGMLRQIHGTLNSRGYIHILDNCAIPSAHLLGYGDDYWFQDDGAPCHRAKIVKDWHADNNIRCLENWPPQSPDLNPIENLWHDIKHALRRKQHHNLKDLVVNVHQCWDELAPERCARLVRSMPDRIRAVLAARGGHTKY